MKEEERVTRDYVESLPIEGERGVRELCMLVRKLGYRDPFSQLTLSNGACVGDLMTFLEDNPGAIAALHDFIVTELLVSDVEEEEDVEEEDVEEEDAEENDNDEKKEVTG